MPLCPSQASSSQFPSNSQTSTVQLTSSPLRTHSVSGSQTASMQFTQSSSQTSSTNLQTSSTQPISGLQISPTQSATAQQTSSTQSTSGSQTSLTQSTSGPHVHTGYTQPISQPHSATMPPTRGISSLFPVTIPMPSVPGKDM